jgi:AraC-like DNA-binding protein
LHAIGVTADSPIVPIRDSQRLVSIVDEMASVYEREESPLLIMEAAGIAWKLLARIGTDRSIEFADPIERAKDYLAQHLDHGISVSALATHVGLSRSQLLEGFRIATGGGVLAFHVQLRMARARMLLEETDQSIANVARRVGYSDPYYFSRHFRRTQGMSPTRFRENLRPSI